MKGLMKGLVLNFCSQHWYSSELSNKDVKSSLVGILSYQQILWH